jgi:hypothetical protein
MRPESLSFLTPYWSGREMMEIHLSSLRRFHPDAPILVSARGGAGEDLETWRRRFAVRSWREDCEYMDAYIRLLERCETRYACILDHDTALLASLGRYVEGLGEGTYDLVGIEERIRLPEHVRREPWPESNGWLRFAPGSTASNFILFDWRAFKARWGMRGILGKRLPGGRHFDFDYGIGQRLQRHHYLLPFHARKYGIGNLLKDGNTPVVWHQWYGSYRTRLACAPEFDNEGSAVYALAQAGERAFIADYPQLDFAGLSPAWGPEFDIRAEQLSLAEATPRGTKGWVSLAMRRLSRWRSYGVRGFAARALARLDRWWRLR